ncbi:MAG: aminotransferase class I/II-fold pyridoxal phosphate-dependent enzyme [Nitriliruptoraceae bacterium]
MAAREGGPLVPRLRSFGTTVFSQMTALAIAHEAVNLGQGFPDEDPPSQVLAAAHAALDAGHNQYAPGPGIAPLKAAVARHQQRWYGMQVDPDTEVTVTFGATEAVAASLLALCEPGDEVVVLEPTYDAYPAVLAVAGAQVVRVPLTPPTPTSVPAEEADPLVRGPWTLDLDRLADAFTDRTRVLLLNSPHNPTGLVLSETELDAVAALCVAHDVVAVTDEVYEHLVYEGAHVPLATREGMRERTITISSAGKTFSCTGWKIGWAVAAPPLTAAVRTTKQFLSFAGGTPLQHAVAVALQAADEVFAEVGTVHRRRRDLLVEGLRGVGVPTTSAAGTYFVTADVAALGWEDGDAFCRWAPAAIGVAGVPVAAFVADPAPVRSLVRFAFCKPDDVLAEGVRRLTSLAG